MFQSTRPHGARPYQRTHPKFLVRFQSTRPHGARLNSLPLAFGFFGFNPRARTGRDRPPQALRCISTSFNPRARTGRDVRYHKVFVETSVSIHAPARGATASRRTHLQRLVVSIHAPARGATAPFRAVGSAARFQSTRPHGARHRTCALDR